ncbi:hypothetical protein R3P38DRAFT_3083553 [Favolaschia claudopus]|uniref:RRM domain-containing protein n=1 Tax=Favolaschia claudopus TaxID=2862362 RepID=A0AAV9ZUZ4_9AGAR
MTVDTPASLFLCTDTNGDNTRGLAEAGDPAKLLGIPTSDSLASTQYHSALNSPVACNTPESSPPIADLISFASEDLLSFSTAREPPPLSPSPSSSSSEFSSNRHQLGDLTLQHIPDETNSDRTSNVYINGLPPNFREEQLHAIAAHFGEILSVRCFTRNSTTPATGYGFVLFKTVEAAEKCIITLRRSDLRPAFSKEPPRDGSITSTSSSSLSSDSGSQSSDFKAKMAQLEDKNSSNVYIEGLPLSADRNTLAALVHPHVIHSTRFLRSKLPNSPTMIAFMRMANRAAADDVILRLKGKTIRGWDGAEGRVHLRIADTLDQRELRRSETTRFDIEAGRLTMAQATLLNYRAKDIQVTHGMEPSPFDVPNQPAEPRNPAPLATTVHELLTGNPGARRAVSLHIPTIQQPITLPPPEARLPHPLAASVHNILAGNVKYGQAQQSQQQFCPPQHSLFAPGPTAAVDTLYAPYARPSLPLSHQPPLHPNVAALFNHSIVTGMQQQQQQQHPASGLRGFPNPNCFEGGIGNSGPLSDLQQQRVKAVQLGRRSASESYSMQQAALQRLLGGQLHRQSSIAAPAPAVVNANAKRGLGSGLGGNQYAPPPFSAPSPASNGVLNKGAPPHNIGLGFPSALPLQRPLPPHMNNPRPDVNVSLSPRNATAPPHMHASKPSFDVEQAIMNNPNNNILHRTTSRAASQPSAPVDNSKPTTTQYNHTNNQISTANNNTSRLPPHPPRLPQPQPQSQPQSQDHRRHARANTDTVLASRSHPYHHPNHRDHIRTEHTPTVDIMPWIRERERCRTNTKENVPDANTPPKSSNDMKTTVMPQMTNTNKSATGNLPVPKANDAQAQAKQDFRQTQNQILPRRYPAPAAAPPPYAPVSGRVFLGLQNGVNNKGLPAKPFP